MREEAGYTAVEACEPLNAQGPKLSKIENGRQGATPEEVGVLCDFYRASAEERDYLVSLAEQRPKRRRRRAGKRDAVPDWFRRFLALEWDATEIKSYQIDMVPGLLQTEDYARSMIRAWEPEADDRLIDKQVETRMRRQEVLRRTGRPSLRLDVVLGEAALRRVQGTKQVMRAQLKHLVKVARRPNITIRVMPFDVPDRISVASAFELFRLTEQNISTVYLEDLFGATYLKEPEEYTQYSSVYGRLRDAALTPEESVAFVDRMAKEYT
ncbi:helix-turn-helix domain-containing protein [Actinophytocola sp. NPDC049390]|uniref:helix-turn-helix domain-containing protein n=1 Tax=Actinophytocola sp. NPDC049390 TaxID=3363894 RepID=UPI00378744F4